MFGAKCDVTASACTVVSLGASSPQSLAAKLGEIATPGDFIGSGASALYAGNINARPAIMAAIAAKGRVYLPCGTYRLDATLVLSGQQVYGAAPSCVTLNINFASGDGVLMTGTRPELRNVRIYTTASRSAGAAVHVDHTYRAVLNDIVVEGSHGADAFLVDGANTTHISRSDLRPPPAAGSTSFAAGAGIHLLGMAVDTHIVGGNVSQWHYGIELSDASGVFVSNLDLVRSGQGILFDPTSSQQVFGVQMSTVLGDTSAADNWYFGGTGPITDVQIANLWASNSQTANGVAVVNQNVNGLSISNPHVLGNYAHGMALVGGKNIAITGGSVTDNSAAGSAQYDGIQISGSDQVRIIGVMSGMGGSLSRPSPGPGQSNLQRYGLNAGTGSNDTRRIIVGMSGFFGNMTGGLNMPTGLNIVNLGNTE